MIKTALTLVLSLSLFLGMSHQAFSVETEESESAIMLRLVSASFLKRCRIYVATSPFLKPTVRAEFIVENEVVGSYEEDLYNYGEVFGSTKSLKRCLIAGCKKASLDDFRKSVLRFYRELRCDQPQMEQNFSQISGENVPY